MHSQLALPPMPMTAHKSWHCTSQVMILLLGVSIRSTQARARVELAWAEQAESLWRLPSPACAAMQGLNPINQREVDEKMFSLDGTDNKGKLGANAILGVSLAVARVRLCCLLAGLRMYVLPCAQDTCPPCGVIYIAPAPVQPAFRGACMLKQLWRDLCKRAASCCSSETPTALLILVADGQ